MCVRQPVTLGYTRWIMANWAEKSLHENIQFIPPAKAESLTSIQLLVNISSFQNTARNGDSKIFASKHYKLTTPQCLTVLLNVNPHFNLNTLIHILTPAVYPLSLIPVVFYLFGLCSTSQPECARLQDLWGISDSFFGAHRIYFACLTEVSLCYRPAVQQAFRLTAVGAVHLLKELLPLSPYIRNGQMRTWEDHTSPCFLIQYTLTFLLLMWQSANIHPFLRSSCHCLSHLTRHLSKQTFLSKKLCKVVAFMRWHRRHNQLSLNIRETICFL